MMAPVDQRVLEDAIHQVGTKDQPVCGQISPSLTSSNNDFALHGVIGPWKIASLEVIPPP